MLLLPLPRRVPAGVTFEAAWALLMAELEHWPGWRLTSIGPGGSWGSHDPEGGRVEGVGSYRTWMTDYWQACSDEEGWESTFVAWEEAEPVGDGGHKSDGAGRPFSRSRRGHLGQPR